MKSICFIHQKCSAKSMFRCCVTASVIYTRMKLLHLNELLYNKNIFINYCNVTVTLYAYVLVCFLVPQTTQIRIFVNIIFAASPPPPPPPSKCPPLIKQILTQGPFSKPWSATVILSLNVNHTTGTDSWLFYFKCTNNLHRHSVSPNPQRLTKFFILVVC